MSECHVGTHLPRDDSVRNQCKGIEASIRQKGGHSDHGRKEVGQTHKIVKTYMMIVRSISRIRFSYDCFLTTRAGSIQFRIKRFPIRGKHTFLLEK